MVAPTRFQAEDISKHQSKLSNRILHRYQDKQKKKQKKKQKPPKQNKEKSVATYLSTTGYLIRAC
jgi:hypothetical protein